MSGIKIDPTDVVKKSKAEANLCSYKISVPATSLEKALDPTIWPLRVRVREFIHYSNKPKQQSSKNSDQPEVSNSSEGPQPQQSPGDIVIDVPTFSRFDPLRDAGVENSNA